MKHDHIIINDAEFRIEFNWNALCDFLETEKLKLTDVDALDNLMPSQITSLIYAGVKEGARLEGKELTFSRLDLGAAMGVQDIAAMLEIFKAHTAVANTAKKKTSWLHLKK